MRATSASPRTAGGLVELPMDRLVELVWSAQTSVIQVETLPEYAVPQDDRLFALWKEGREPSPDDLSLYEGWFGHVRGAVQTGVQVDRVHIVPEQLSEYLRFEIEIAYFKFCGPAGERVGVVRHPLAMAAGALPQGDFYLIDEQRLLLPRYDEQNRWVALYEDLNPHSISSHRDLRIRLLAMAEPVKEFYERIRSRESIP